jgi:glycosyltransferase involved in cell wall biosynthesis
MLSSSSNKFKILHITNEFSKKNFSISSLIVFFSKIFNQKKNYRVKILTNSVDEKLFNIDRNNFVSLADISLKKYISFFKLVKYVKEADLIHVHGIWSIIQIFSIIYCNIIQKKIVIHPHGMLLSQATKSAGTIKFILKKFTLHILKFFINKNYNYFISITEEETEAINLHFPKVKIFNIPNPIPFNLTLQSPENKISKQFTYFGRIHPHKNIDLLIQSFLNAKLPSSWKLKIFGINDDNSYKEKLKKKIGDNQNVEILDPVFDYTRQKIMNESWANILISKSEVLSLSILESCFYGLPTIVNEKLKLKKFEKSIIKTNNHSLQITDKIKKVASWNYDFRLKLKHIIQNNFKKYKAENDTQQQFENFYNKVRFAKTEKNKTKINRLIFENLIKINRINFIAISSTYTFNLMFSSLLVILLVFFKEYNLATELGLITSFWLSVTQIFSSNMRSIITSENNFELAEDNLQYRLLFFILSYSIFIIILNLFFQSENLLLLSSISFLILSQWFFEMFLVKNEISNNYKIFYSITVVNIFIISFVVVLLSSSLLEYMPIIFFSYGFFLLIFGMNNLKIFEFNKTKILNIINKNIGSIAFFSSLSIISSSFIWRVIIYILFEKNIASIFYACFSIGSFPGTFFNSVIGPTYVKKRIAINNFFKNLAKFLFILLNLLLIFVSVKIYKLHKLDLFYFQSNIFIFFVIIVSLIGSYFMIRAMYSRHRQINQNFYMREVLFKKDIIYGLSITFFVPVLYILGGTFSVSFAFCVSSIFAYFVYNKNFIF